MPGSLKRQACPKKPPDLTLRELLEEIRGKTSATNFLAKESARKKAEKSRETADELQVKRQKRAVYWKGYTERPDKKAATKARNDKYYEKNREKYLEARRHQKRAKRIAAGLPTNPRGPYGRKKAPERRSAPDGASLPGSARKKVGERRIAPDGASLPGSD